jgi:hypothetical protein
MDANDLGALSTFLMVAEERSLRVRQSVLVFPPRRSATRCESAHLRARLHPAFTEIQEALGQVSGLRRQPAGRVRLRTSCSTSRPTIAGWTSWPQDSMQVFSSVSTSRKVRVSPDLKPVIVVRRGALHHIPNRNRRATSSATAVLTFGVEMPAYTAGSSRRAGNPSGGGQRSTHC